MFRILLPLILLLCVLSGQAVAQDFTVDKVEVEGVQRVDPNFVRSVIQAEPGAVSAAQIDKDLRAIFKTGRFEDVRADLEERDGQQVLIYQVSERPLLRRIEFSGNDELSKDKLRELITFSVPSIYSPAAVQKSVQAIRGAYAEEGFYAAEISPELKSTGDNEATLSFAIDEGEKIMVDDIEFRGNTVLSDSELRKVMQTKEKWFLSWLTGRGTFYEDALQTDLEIIADEYYNRGYVQVKVKQPEITYSEDRTSLSILVEIEEGEQFRVGDVNVRGDLMKPADELLALVRVKKGEVFSREALRESVFALNDLYANEGYAYVNVSPLTRIDNESRVVNLMFEIEQGVQVSVDRIHIRGNTKTRDKVIRREMRLMEGETYSAGQLKESRRRINNLGFFEEVNVTTAKGDTDAEMDVDVEVTEKPTGMFTVGVGYSSVDGLIGQGSISQENFLGRGLKLNLAGSLGSDSSTYQFGVTDPYFLDTKLTLGFDIYNTEREWVDFSRRTTGGDLKVGYPLTDNTRTFFVYRYEEKDIYDVDETASLFIREQEGASTLSSLSASLARNTTDYRLDPTMGYASSATVEYAGLGGTEKFIKYDLDHRHFWPWIWGTVFSAHGHLGYIQDIGGEEIPIDERYFLGGLNTIRGFESRQVGPRLSNVFKDQNGNVLYQDYEYIGGEKAAYFNFEYTFPLIKDMGLKGVLFFDTGNAWSEQEDFFSSMRYSAGGGIRWFSPLGPLRLEWGRNLDPYEDEPNSRFEFSIGSFF